MAAHKGYAVDVAVSYIWPSFYAVIYIPQALSDLQHLVK